MAKLLTVSMGKTIWQDSTGKGGLKVLPGKKSRIRVSHRICKNWLHSEEYMNISFMSTFWCFKLRFVNESQ
jgi:hypothetical protein